MTQFDEIVSAIDNLWRAYEVVALAAHG